MTSLEEHADSWNAAPQQINCTCNSTCGCLRKSHLENSNPFSINPFTGKNEKDLTKKQLTIAPKTRPESLDLGISDIWNPNKDPVQTWNLSSLHSTPEPISKAFRNHTFDTISSIEARFNHISCFIQPQGIGRWRISSYTARVEQARQDLYMKKPISKASQCTHCLKTQTVSFGSTDTQAKISF